MDANVLVLVVLGLGFGFYLTCIVVVAICHQNNAIASKSLELLSKIINKFK